MKFKTSFRFLLKLLFLSMFVSCTDNIGVFENSIQRFKSKSIPNGQIIIDPDHPGRMVYNNTYLNGKLKPCVSIGPGDPEELLYLNSQANIDLLIERGARSTYVMAVVSDDFVAEAADPGTGVELDNHLEKWEGYITQLEEAGIITVFIFLDDNVVRPSNWKEIVDKSVAKFKHHKLLIWSVAEEYAEGLGSDGNQAREIAARIKSQDDNDHIVAIHQNHSISFDFNDTSTIDMFMMQYNVSNTNTIHNGVVSAWNNVNGSKIINLAEVDQHADQNRATARKWNWAAVMGGASMVQVYRMGRAGFPSATNDPNKYRDCARTMDFLESTDINSMVPSDSRAYADTQWVLASQSQSYILYNSNLSGNMGVRNIQSGIYTLKWFDCASGSTVVQNNVSVTAGNRAWSKPSAFGNEIALYLERSGSIPDNGFPVDLQGDDRPEEKTIKIGVSRPSNAVKALLTMEIYDADNVDEGELYINGKGPVGLFGDKANSGNGSETVAITFETDADWWTNGENSLRFVHTRTGGFRVDSATVCFETAADPVSLSIEITNMASDRTYNLMPDGINENDMYYSDRTMTISTLPQLVENAAFIQTPNDDKNETQADFLTFTVNKDVTVYVAYDERATVLPDWMNDFTDTEEMITTTDKYCDLKVYSKTYPAGTITLGGNQAGGASGAKTMYIAFVQAEETQSVQLSVTVTNVASGNEYLVSDDYIEPGSVYYSDRTLTVTTLPIVLSDAYYIQTANNDKYETVADFLTLTVNKEVTVYIAYDERATVLPGWMTDFTDTGEMIATTDEYCDLKIYSKTYPAGVISLGGNLAGGADGAKTMYIVLVK